MKVEWNGNPPYIKLPRVFSVFNSEFLTPTPSRNEKSSCSFYIHSEANGGDLKWKQTHLGGKGCWKVDMSHEKKGPRPDTDSMKYRLINRDPEIMVYFHPHYTWVVFHPLMIYST